MRRDDGNNTKTNVVFKVLLILSLKGVKGRDISNAYRWRVMQSYPARALDRRLQED